MIMGTQVWPVSLVSRACTTMSEIWTAFSDLATARLLFLCSLKRRSYLAGLPGDATFFANVDYAIDVGSLAQNWLSVCGAVFDVFRDKSRRYLARFIYYPL